MQSIHEALNSVNQQISSLDAEILLAHAIKKSRSYLLAFPEYKLQEEEQKYFNDLIRQRKKEIPIAYLLHTKEFWSLPLRVTEHTLIPRPETELLIEIILQKMQGPHKKIVDLGTGSGAIALALAYEQSTWNLHATDSSVEALEVAKLNAHSLQINNIYFHQGHWLEALPNEKFHAIVSNPPYLAEMDPHLKQLPFEPKSALVAGPSGLEALEIIISEAKKYLLPNGYLFLEHGYNQGQAVKALLLAAGYDNIQLYQDLACVDRVTTACIS